MADTDSPSDARQSTPAKPFLSRLIGVFIEPGETFEDIARKPDWISPLILLILVSLATVETMLAKIGMARIIMQQLTQSGQAARMDPAQLNQAVQRGASIAGIFVQVAAVFGAPIVLLVVAGIGLLVLNGLFGQHARFKQVFSTACYAYMPHILGAAMAIPLMIFGDPNAFVAQTPAPTSPGFFMNPATSSHVAYALASSLDIFTIWFLVLLAIGLSRVSEKKAKTASIFLVFAGAWVLLIIAKVGFALLTGR